MIVVAVAGEVQRAASDRQCHGIAGTRIRQGAAKRGRTGDGQGAGPGAGILHRAVAGDLRHRRVIAAHFQGARHRQVGPGG